MDAQDFKPVFEALKAILEPYAPFLFIEKDLPGNYSLNTPYIERFKKPVFFGSTVIQKNYVSFYLMPVYIFPDLLAVISPALRKHMQGKSCFNFKSIDTELFEELAELTRRGVERFREEKQSL